MPASLWRLSLEEFREKVASDDSTVAAVSTAAVSAACALNLIVMVLDVIGKRKDFQGDRQRLQALAEAAREESGRLARYADEDPAAYAGYLRCLRMPKTTEAERRERRLALTQALRRATEVPLAAARTAVAGINICAEAAALAHGSVATDLGGAASLLAGAARAMLLSVDANLVALGESEFHDQVSGERRELEDAAAKKEQALRKKLATL
ncbi:MAG TPA: cyclodeaminase/cyclohydrolase family protein [Bryobacteraceae bacterium]|nr:cyclodeaminase/cyclohydrolase family protein [Bryobacteraceae bacterium]